MWDCPDCQTVKYCSETCYKAHYNKHGDVCIAILISGGGPEVFPGINPVVKRNGERKEARRILENGPMWNPKTIMAKLETKLEAKLDKWLS